MTVSTILLIIAFILFVLASIPQIRSPFGLGWTGLAFWVLSILLAGGLSLH